MPFIINSLFKIFLSTLSLRRATWLVSYSAPSLLYFYPRSPCGERRQHRQSNPAGHRISIHALLAESDTTFSGTVHRKEISIHALLAESDLCRCCVRSCSWHYFYPRSPCGERRLQLFLYYQDNTISIHALLAESDFFDAVQIVIVIVFLSTLSLRRATRLFFIVFDLFRFLSTLSLRRATTVPGGGHISKSNFYPRSPCGERHF